MDSRFLLSYENQAPGLYSFVLTTSGPGTRQMEKTSVPQSPLKLFKPGNPKPG